MALPLALVVAAALATTLTITLALALTVTLDYIIDLPVCVALAFVLTLDLTLASTVNLALDLTLSADAPLDYVVLEVPLPAGLEAIDTSIGKGRRAMTLGGASGWWASHHELRADRALIFADRLPPGERHHTLYLRAATPVDFVMPPPHAEAMYLPEIHGHGVARRIRVAPPAR